MSRSVIHSVREQLITLPADSFVRACDLAGERAAVTTALSRIAGEHKSPVIRVRRGLYWRTVWTRFGPSGPWPHQIVRQITTPSTGPAGAAAVHSLQLTTQVPGTEYFAVPGRGPRPIWGVKFLDRPTRRADFELQWLEVALLETFRVGFFIEVDWPYIVDRIRKLSDDGWIRLDVVRAVADEERHLEVRRQIALLCDEVPRWVPLSIDEDDDLTDDAMIDIVVDADSAPSAHNVQPGERHDPLGLRQPGRGSSSDPHRRPSSVRIDPGTCGGEPHLAGSRVTTISIAALADRGYEIEDIARLYPELPMASLVDALDFERSRGGHRGGAISAACADSRVNT